MNRKILALMTVTALAGMTGNQAKASDVGASMQEYCTSSPAACDARFGKGTAAAYQSDYQSYYQSNYQSDYQSNYPTPGTIPTASTNALNQAGMTALLAKTGVSAEDARALGTIADILQNGGQKKTTPVTMESYKKFVEQKIDSSGTKGGSGSSGGGLGGLLGGNIKIGGVTLSGGIDPLTGQVTGSASGYGLNASGTGGASGATVTGGGYGLSGSATANGSGVSGSTSGNPFANYASNSGSSNNVLGPPLDIGNDEAERARRGIVTNPDTGMLELGPSRAAQVAIANERNLCASGITTCRN